MRRSAIIGGFFSCALLTSSALAQPPTNGRPKECGANDNCKEEPPVQASPAETITVNVHVPPPAPPPKPSAGPIRPSSSPSSGGGEGGSKPAPRPSAPRGAAAAAERQPESKPKPKETKPPAPPAPPPAPPKPPALQCKVVVERAPDGTPLLCGSADLGCPDGQTVGRWKDNRTGLIGYRCAAVQSPSVQTVLGRVWARVAKIGERSREEQDRLNKECVGPLPRVNGREVSRPAHCTSVDAGGIRG